MIAAVLSLGLVSSALAFTSSPSSRAGSVMTMAAERSKAMPFLLRPANLDESMVREPLLTETPLTLHQPGYKGFDPLGLASINELGLDAYWMREAELKHCRLAMLAVVGLLAQGAGFVVPGMVTLSSLEIFQLMLSHCSPLRATRSRPSGQSSRPTRVRENCHPLYADLLKDLFSPPLFSLALPKVCTFYLCFLLNLRLQYSAESR